MDGEYVPFYMYNVIKSLHMHQRERERDLPFTHVKQMKCVFTSSDACQNIKEQR